MICRRTKDVMGANNICLECFARMQLQQANMFQSRGVKDDVGNLARKHVVHDRRTSHVSQN